MALRDQYNFEYGEDKVVNGVSVNDKCKTLAKKIKEIIDNKNTIQEETDKWYLEESRILNNSISSLNEELEKKGVCFHTEEIMKAKIRKIVFQKTEMKPLTILHIFK